MAIWTRNFQFQNQSYRGQAIEIHFAFDKHWIAGAFGPCLVGFHWFNGFHGAVHVSIPATDG